MAAPSGTGAGRAPLLRVVAECGQSMARAGELLLPHGTVPCPVFMPVGTRGTAKGITAEQLRALGCGLCLGNAYHLGTAPVSGAGRGGGRRKWEGGNARCNPAHVEGARPEATPTWRQHSAEATPTHGRPRPHAKPRPRRSRHRPQWGPPPPFNFLN